MSRADPPPQLTIPVPDQPRRSPLEEACPKCGAPAGELCRTISGGSSAREHVARRRQAAFLPVPR